MEIVEISKKSWGRSWEEAGEEGQSLPSSHSDVEQ